MPVLIGLPPEKQAEKEKRLWKGKRNITEPAQEAEMERKSSR